MCPGILNVRSFEDPHGQYYCPRRIPLLIETLLPHNSSCRSLTDTVLNTIVHVFPTPDPPVLVSLDLHESYTRFVAVFDKATNRPLHNSNCSGLLSDPSVMGVDPMYGG